MGLICLTSVKLWCSLCCFLYATNFSLVICKLVSNFIFMMPNFMCICLNMFRVHEKVVWGNLGTSDMSDSFFFMMSLHLWPMLGYCNSLFTSLSKFIYKKWQCIQNTVATIVSNSSRYTRKTPVLKKLHWLCVEYCSVFKTATLIYKFIHTGFSKYFSPYFTYYSSCCSTKHSHGVGNFLVETRISPIYKVCKIV